MFAFFGFWWSTVAAGAVATSVPIIIHLLNRKRFRVVVWAAMQFLLNAQRQNIRRMRLEQIILLAVRTLLILLIVLAMASVTGWAEDLWRFIWPEGGQTTVIRGGRTHKIIVLDGSYSMALKKEGRKTCFDQAKALAAQLVQDHSSNGDGFSVILMTESPQLVVSEPSPDGSKVARVIRELRQPHGNADVLATLNAVATLLNESPSKFHDREVYFLTDLQQATWAVSSGSPPSPKQQPKKDVKLVGPLAEIQKQARTIFVDVGRDGANNLAVTSLSIDEPFVVTKKEIAVLANIKNFGKQTRQPKVQLKIGRARTAAGEPASLKVEEEKPVKVEAGREVTERFKYRFPTPGNYAIQIHLQDDDLDLDNDRAVIVTVRDTIPVLLVNGKPAEEALQQATGFLRFALNPFVKGPIPPSAVLRPKVINVKQFEELSDASLASYDCVFLCDVKQLGTSEIHRLQTHLHRGGGLIIAAGPNVADNLEAYNRVLYKKGKGLLPAKLEGLQSSSKDHYFRLIPGDEGFEKPPLDVFRTHPTAFDRVRIHSYIRTELAPDGRPRKLLGYEPQRQSDSKLPLDKNLPIGNAAIIEWNPPLPPPADQQEQKGKPGERSRTSGPVFYRGKVILITTSVNMDWTSWPGSPSYGALMQELARYAMSGRLREHSATVGAVLEEYLPNPATNLEVNVRLPGSDEEAVVKKTRTRPYGDASVFRFDETAQSGIYRATVGQDPQEYLFAVNVPITTLDQKGSESDLARLNKNELAESFPGWEFQLVTRLADVRHEGGPANVERVVQQSPLGPEIAHWLLLLVLVLLFVEVVLAWSFGHHSAVPGSSIGMRESPRMPGLRGKLALAGVIAATNLVLYLLQVLSELEAVVSFVLVLVIVGMMQEMWLSVKPGRFFPLVVTGIAAVCFLFGGFVLLHAARTGDFLGFLPQGARDQLEVWMNIPPPASGESSHWNLRFTPYLGSHTGLLVTVLALGALALVVLVYRAEPSTTGKVYKVLLGGLRLFLILMALLVLLPQLQLHFQREGWPDVVILIDDSRSMGEPDNYRDESTRDAAARLGKQAKQDLQERLPKQIADLEAKIRDKTEGPERQELQSLRDKLAIQLKELGSENWQPRRLHLVQTLLTREQPNWLSTLLNRRNMRVHIYHLDKSGRADKLNDETGKPISLTEPRQPEQQDRAKRAIANLRAEGETSRLGTAVRQVLDIYRGAPLAAVVMFTDGVTTEGEDLEQVSGYAAQKGVPLFFIGIGDSHDTRDLKLSDLQAEDTVYVGDTINFVCRLTGHGYKDLTLPVILYEKEMPSGILRKLAEVRVQVDPRGASKEIRLKHQAKEPPGEKHFVIQAELPQTEKGKGPPSEFTRLEKTIFVQKADVIKVLYVEGSPRYEYRFIKTLLERETTIGDRKQSIDLSVLLLDADADFWKEDKSAQKLKGQLPANRDDLFQYHVIILGDVNPNDDRLKGRLNDLADFVREHGGGLLLIAGPNYSPHAFKGTPLADVLPIEPTGAAPPENEDLGEGDLYRPELTPIGRDHAIFKFSSDPGASGAIWDGLTKMYWCARNYRVKPAAEVWAVHEKLRGEKIKVGGVDEDRLPLVVHQFVGSGRALFFGFEETWRWRFRENEKYFNTFWVQTVRYLSKTRQSRTRLYLDRQTPSIYRRGEQIRVIVKFPDNIPIPGLEPGAKAGKADVKVRVERKPPPTPDGQPDVETETLSLVKVEGSHATFEAPKNRTPEGKYKFWLLSPSVKNEGGSVPSAECLVETPPGELDRLRMNRAEMELAARTSGGQFFTLDTADEVLEKLPRGPRVALNTPTEPKILWNHFLVFMVVLFLLSAEWLLRKRKRLL
jgi:hypothetical protein